jgi:hypothetical protein
MIKKSLKWYKQDGMLKRVSKLALETTRAASSNQVHRLRSLSVTRAYVLSGIISGGKFHTRASIPEDRTSEELKEAVELFQFASQSDDEDCGVYKSHAEGMLLEARSRTLYLTNHGTTSSPCILEAGSWALLHGLPSSVGSLLNMKLGLVSEDGLRNGRLVVKVDGCSGNKLIKPSNLLALPCEDTAIALVSTMETSAQWTYMRPMATKIRQLLVQERSTGRQL